MLAGLDLSNSYCGIASLDATRGVLPARPPRLAFLRSLRASSVPRATAAEVVTLARQASRHPCPVGIERPPPTAKADVNHGKQANIGFTLGYLIGLVDARLEAFGSEVQLVEVSPWRDRMLRYSAMWGVVRAKPGRTPEAVPGDNRQRFEVLRDGAAFLVTWDGCGHHQRFGSLAALKRIPARCGQCERQGLTTMDPAEWRRMQWKRLACELVAAHWPDQFRVLVDSARSRARVPREDWELMGVSDACEAVWIALALLEV